jgi:hypothetical protein
VNNPVEKPVADRPMELILREFWRFAHALGGRRKQPVF